MDCKVEKIKHLQTDNGKTFKVGEEIAFRAGQRKYIGEIVKIGKNSISLKSVQVDSVTVTGTVVVDYDAISENSCDFVSYS